MSTPAVNLQHSAHQAISAAALAYRDGVRAVARAIALGREHLLSGDDIREAFEREGVTYFDQLAAVENGVEL